MPHPTSASHVVEAMHEGRYGKALAAFDCEATSATSGRLVGTGDCIQDVLHFFDVHSSSAQLQCCDYGRFISSILFVLSERFDAA